MTVANPYRPVWNELAELSTRLGQAKFLRGRSLASELRSLALELQTVASTAEKLPEALPGLSGGH